MRDGKKAGREERRPMVIGRREGVARPSPAAREVGAGIDDRDVVRREGARRDDGAAGPFRCRRFPPSEPEKVRPPHGRHRHPRDLRPCAFACASQGSACCSSRASPERRRRCPSSSPTRCSASAEAARVQRRDPKAFWVHQIVARLEDRKPTGPLGLKEPATAKVRFVLDRDGRLVSKAIETSSGVPAVDKGSHGPAGARPAVPADAGGPRREPP